MQGELEESLNEARAERPPRKGNSKGFSSTCFLSPCPKIPVRAGALQSSPGCISSFVVPFILRPPELQAPDSSTAGIPPGGNAAIKNPLWGEEGAPWPGLAVAAPLLPPKSPRGHPSLPQGQGKGGTRSLLRGTASPNPALAHGLAARRGPHAAPPELRSPSRNRASPRRFSSSGVKEASLGIPGKGTSTAVTPRHAQLLLHCCPTGVFASPRMVWVKGP